MGLIDMGLTRYSEQEITELLSTLDKNKRFQDKVHDLCMDIRTIRVILERRTDKK